MSASKRKLERKNDPDRLAALEAQTVAAKQSAKKAKKLAITAISVFILFALVAIFFASPLPYTVTTAVSVEGHNLSPVEFSYFYHDAYDTYVSQYANTFSSMLGSGAPAETDICDEETGQTWGEFYQEQAMTNALATVADTYQMYDLAVANGTQLTAEEQASIDELPAYLDQAATYYGATTGEGYIAGKYGSGTSVASYQEYVRIMSLAQAYGTQYKDSLTYTKEQYDEAYDENPDAYTNATYKAYYISVSNEEEEDGTPIVDMEASKAKADEMAAASQNDVDAFNQYAIDFAADETTAARYEDPDATLRENTSIASAIPQLQDWLKDDARAEGDTIAVAVEERGYYVAYFLERPAMDTMLPNLRTIYMPVTILSEDGEDYAISALENIETKFAEGEQTAEAFGELAKTSSQDASAPSGGVMANYLPGTIAGLDEAWLFDAARKPGDTTTLSTDAGHYFFFYEGQGTDLVTAMIDRDLRIADYNTWYADNTDDYLATTNGFGMAFLAK